MYACKLDSLSNHSATNRCYVFEHVVTAQVGTPNAVRSENVIDIIFLWIW